MKILDVVPSVQHPTMRDALRDYEFLLALAQRHEMTLLALTRAEVTPEEHGAERSTLVGQGLRLASRTE